MITIFLIRHGATDAVGVSLSGRTAGIGLNARGREQAAQLPDRLAAVALSAIYSSPLDRARQTAAPLASAQGLELLTQADFTELDFGDWTGRRFDALAADPVWQRFNACRGSTRIPGGESMLDVQRRVATAIDELRRRHDAAAIAIVTHGDVIRAALSHYLGLSIDLCLRLEVSPASISIVSLGDSPPTIHMINGMGTVDGEHFTS